MMFTCQCSSEVTVFKCIFAASVFKGDKQPKHHQDTSETPRRHDQDTSETHHWDRDTAQAGSRGPNGTRLPLNLELATPSYRYWEKWVETFFFITKTTVFEPQRQMEKK